MLLELSTTQIKLQTPLPTKLFLSHITNFRHSYDAPILYAVSKRLNPGGVIVYVSLDYPYLAHVPITDSLPNGWRVEIAHRITQGGSGDVGVDYYLARRNVSVSKTS